MDELIKRLRNRRICIQQSGNLDDFPLLREAADAIEELTRENESLAKSVNEASEILRRRWIPVTERLPVEKINPNTHDFEYILCATIWGDVRPFKYGTPIGSKDAHFWNGAGYVDAYVTHWMPLPTPPTAEEGE